MSAALAAAPAAPFAVVSGVAALRRRQLRAQVSVERQRLLEPEPEVRWVARRAIGGAAVGQPQMPQDGDDDLAVRGAPPRGRAYGGNADASTT